MKDSDLHWLHRRLPLCYCGSGPRLLDNKLPTILYMDVNDDGTFYVRWICDEGRHTVSCYNLDLHGPNLPLKEPASLNVTFQDVLT